MSTSGRKINYCIRPAKNIERKMMRDTFLRLFPFSPLSNYQYIGFGSKYFVDFLLFHKTLHINEMISIEADDANRKRYNFNKPFDCIKIIFGHSTDALPKVDFRNKKSIVWLDYDSRFSLFMLDDVYNLVRSLESGSVINVSYNSEPYKTGELKGIDAYRRRFEEIVGEDNIPSDFKEQGWANHRRFSMFLRSCIIARIDRAVTERNFTLAPNKRIQKKQIMYFEYADGQMMSTLSFLLFSQEHEHLVEQCKFKDLHFCRFEDQSYYIQTPNLTLKEIRFLMEKMPSDDFEYDRKVFTENDVKSFSENYKYFPSFNEIEIL